MAVVTTFYTMDGKEGVDLNFIQTSISVTTDPSVPAPRAKLGDRVQGNAGSWWMFVQASATVTCFNTVAIDQNYKAANVTQGMITSNVYTYGVFESQPNQFGATVSIGNANGGVANTGDFFWALMGAIGGAQLNVLTTALAGARLFVNVGTPGVLSTTASNSYFLGLQVVNTLATTTVVTPAEFIGQFFVPVSVTA